jgi:HSP20 family protein
MIHEPRDIFDEMDEMLAHLFSGMGRRTGSGEEYRDGFHIVIRGNDGDAEAEATVPRGQTAFEPTADVQQIGNEVKVVADLPGITPESLRLAVRNGRLVIDAGDADYHYHTTAALPPVDVASMQYTLKNGVLDVTFSVLPDQEKQH